jgi:hypothetical protein
MKIHVRLRYVFRFGEKVSEFRCQVSGVRVEKLEDLKPETLRLDSITNNLDLYPFLFKGILKNMFRLIGR